MLGYISIPDQNNGYQAAEWVIAEMKDILER